MANFHLHAQIIKRSAGRSAVAASAYRAGEKIKNEHDGITHNYTPRKDIVHSEILLPDHAPRKFADRATLWNGVEKSEKQWNSQLAREINIALPIEFDRAEQIAIMREYVQENFVSKGMCADFAIHDKKEGNPHAHIMLTIRPLNADGTWGAKSRKEYILDRNGEKILTKKGNWKNRHVDLTDWNDKETLIKWRENWAEICNEKFKAKGIDERIDHRTLEAQGIDREPTIHEGRNPDRIRENQEIKARNEVRNPENIAEYMHELKEGYFILEKEVAILSQKIAEIEREINIFKCRADKISERAEQLKTTQIRITEMQKQRQNMGILSNKSQIDTQIKRLLHSHEQAGIFFKNEFKIAPEQAQNELKMLEIKVHGMKSECENLRRKLEPYVWERDKFALEYQRQKMLMEINPNRQKIVDRMEQLSSSAPPHTAHERLARLKSERILNTQNYRNFSEILKQVSAKQAQELIRLPIHERLQERGKTTERRR